ncbi:MAG: tyrosine-type recombinase/integrase [Bacteroidaceae bacterium]|nr:tyrosine-type recombinase/integrase [Bacteroidaceae bacterium]
MTNEGTWTDAFLEYLKSERNYSPRTIESYASDLAEFQDFIESLGREVDFRDVTSTDVREWMVYLMDEKHFAVANVNRKLSTLRSLYRYLRMMGYVELNPMAKITGPKKQKNLPTFVREKDMDRLFEITSEDQSFKGVMKRLVVMMFYETGMRRAELLSLDDARVDLNMKQIKVLGKRNKERIIPFGKELEDEIKLYLQKRQEIVNAQPERFFINEHGKPLTESTVTTIVKDSLSLVTTQKKRSPHVLRHSFATAMLNNDADLGSIQKVLGHQSLATTEVYTHLSFEELKNAYKNAHPRS